MRVTSSSVERVLRALSVSPQGLSPIRGLSSPQEWMKFERHPEMRNSIESLHQNEGEIWFGFDLSLYYEQVCVFTKVILLACTELIIY